MYISMVSILLYKGRIDFNRQVKLCQTFDLPILPSQSYFLNEIYAFDRS